MLTATRHLALLDKGCSARIAAVVAPELADGHIAPFALRLAELGFVAGAEVSVIGFGLLGKDPIAVRVNGSTFGLRRDEARCILLVEEA